MLVLAVGFFYRQLKKVPDITGEWHSEVFSDPNEGHPNRHQYYFKFKSDGEHLFGTVRWVDPPGEPTGIIYPVGNGKIEGNKISFDYFGGWFHGGAVGNTTQKESFVGTISGNKIRFIYQREDALPIRHQCYKISRRAGRGAACRFAGTVVFVLGFIGSLSVHRSGMTG